MTLRADGVKRVAAAILAGGTVTQGTSKSTGVTLNTPSGQITMNGASLNDNALVSFTVTNSVVGAYDTVVLSHGSGGTSGAYGFWMTAIAAGSFQISLWNKSGGAKSEAVVLHFAIIGGAAS